MTVAPGGYGKTSLIIVNVIEMCLGTGLIGPAPSGGQLSVAYWNAEDPPEEVERRIAAVCLPPAEKRPVPAPSFIPRRTATATMTPA